MVHICFIISSLCNEGPTNVMYNIIKYVDFAKFKISIITLMPEKENSRIDEFRKFPIDIYQIAPTVSLSTFRLFNSLRVLVEKIRPDALHSHCSRSLYLMCFLPRKFKRIYTIHIYPGYQHIQILGPIKGRITAWLNHYFTRKCDLPIGCAESVGWQYKENRGWNIKCIPNGASTQIWNWDRNEKEELRKELGLKNDVKYFIFIGRFSQEKNPDVLINVFNCLKKERVSLIMLGNGVLWDNLRQIASENIVMPGFTTRVYDYLKVADFYISTSDVEGLANTVLESMSVGLPMILSDIPSHHEIMNNFKDNIAGYLINPHNITDVKEKILKILDFDIDKTSSTIKKVYQNKYTAEIMSESYQNEYQNICEGLK